MCLIESPSASTIDLPPWNRSQHPSGYQKLYSFQFPEANKDMFNTVQELLDAPLGWDVVVLQDYSQGPAREESRKQSLEVLEAKYIPQLSAMQARTGTMPLLMLYTSWGYLRPTKGSEEIGDFSTMTRKLAAGTWDSGPA